MQSSPDFKGYINDVGGPSANIRLPSCKKQERAEAARIKTAWAIKVPQPCCRPQRVYEILREMRALPGVKKVFIRSGIRYDYLMADPQYKKILKELVEHHISGQLKVALEHCSENVLRLMGKPSFALYRKFSEDYKK